MTAAELIAELSKLPPDTLIVHCTGTMQDREPIEDLINGEPGQAMWTGNTWTGDGKWVELL